MKQQFRSKEGCCICSTKSSTTRFQPSADYESSFLAVFGAKVRQRAGQICNACVLCVKRGGSGGGGVSGSGGGATSSKQASKMAPYAKVVDSRKGTGPKHMKQISKRNRRRELREAAAKAITANKQLAMGGEMISIGASVSSASAACISGGANGGIGGGSGANASAIGSDSSAGNFNSLAVGSVGSDKSLSSASSMMSGSASAGCSGLGSGAAGGAAVTSTPSAGAAEFRAPMAPPASERQHYYKKRVIMKPIKTPDTRQEISDLFDAVIRSRKLNPSEGPLSVQQVHSAFLNTKRRRMMAGNSGSETASVGSTEPPESFTSDTCSSDTTRSNSSGKRL